jgi:hypothetical protein
LAVAVQVLNMVEAKAAAQYFQQSHQQVAVLVKSAARAVQVAQVVVVALLAIMVAVREIHLQHHLLKVPMVLVVEIMLQAAAAVVAQAVPLEVRVLAIRVAQVALVLCQALLAPQQDMQAVVVHQAVKVMVQVQVEMAAVPAVTATQAATQEQTT